ncbi:flagellar basal-body MS-ring/collar protein FliF [Rickettsiales endosymbiont of Stachyamoeba lipophora]|uniref:flagellar basal-body MS-ring/collar protein FliF n=1 Tax=Rickettsiales endosymbiont of Stachyamoeba lipophora TaxID=2486578 RepID=UPI000F6529AD|nr:flagellar basal-body MS-ring/collar protein FliF [Rickettsiales endosymbiont of Stachyamoeba lipophora]AZL15199.1 flagellar M-ring protein FliF [Rickettsiales endosymbiont of Stachyamoeba lipophora]
MFQAFLNYLKSFSSGKLILITSLVVSFGFGSLMLALSYTKPSMSLLYSNLDLSDSSEIISELDARNIQYEIRDNGSQILIPEDKILKLRMDMAQKGLPNKGSMVGYEIFDQSDSLGTSNFVLNVNLVRALEGELARTISSFASIQSARVHLVLPKKELFTREKQQPSASVMVKMFGKNTLNKEQINAVANLVSSAVPDLDISKVTIIDNKGRALKTATNKDENDLETIISNSTEYKLTLENRLKHIIESMLSQSIGDGHIKAEVNADINFDRIVTNSEIYDPDGQVVRSVQTIQENENSSEGNQANVSVANNLPNTAQVSNSPGATSNAAKLDETTNYEISKTIRNHISETGTIKRLSVAVLVDGNYEYDEKIQKVIYTPRSQEELDKYAALVKSAIGYDESRHDKVEILNLQFNKDLETLRPESLADWFKEQFASLMQTFVIAIVVVLIIVLIIRPIAIRAFEFAKEDEEDIVSIKDVLTDPSSIEIKQEDVEYSTIDIQKTSDGKGRSNTVKALNEVIGKHPKETISIMRKWFEEES